jgi:hypothetical protein
MKYVLHCLSWALCVAVAYPIKVAFGTGWYFAALVVLGAAMILQWIEGRLSVERGWRYGFWRKS